MMTRAGVLGMFPTAYSRSLGERWMESRAAGHEPAPIWHAGAAAVSGFNYYAVTPAPKNFYRVKQNCLLETIKEKSIILWQRILN